MRREGLAGGRGESGAAPWPGGRYGECGQCEAGRAAGERNELAPTWPLRSDDMASLGGASQKG